MATLEQRVQYARAEHEAVNTMKQDHARQMGEIKGIFSFEFELFLFVLATIKMLMEAEMENQERGAGGLLGMMGAYGMGMGMGMGDFGEDPRKRGHAAYVVSCHNTYTT